MMESAKNPPVADLDPVFIKALKLLNSKSKNSTEQLKQMLDEAVAQRKAELAFRRTEGEPSGYSKSSIVKRDALELSRKRDAEKANLDKLKQELMALSDEVPFKKLKLESGNSPQTSNSISPRSDGKEQEKEREKPKPRGNLREIDEDIFFGQPSSSLQSFPSRGKDLDKMSEKEEKEKDLARHHAAERESKNKKEVVDTSDSDTEVSDTDPQEFVDKQFELDVGELTCVTCQSLNVTPSNRLVECQECHLLYHQECHKPPVTENVNDPRFVWYCHKCTKNLKKMANSVSKTSQKKSKSVAPVAMKDSPISKPSKNDPSVLQPFKRIEVVRPAATKDGSSSNSSQSGSSSRGLTGLASLAANLSGKSSSSSDLSKLTPKPDSSSNRLSLGHSAFTSSRTDSSKSDKSKFDAGSSSSKITKMDPGKSSTTSGPSKSSQSSSSSKPSTSATSKVGTGNSGSSGSYSNDKRLLMMKKAVNKMNEKR